jgi:hypothetical protein
MLPTLRIDESQPIRIVYGLQLLNLSMPTIDPNLIYR